jgi:hypothetical protein
LETRSQYLPFYAYILILAAIILNFIDIALAASKGIDAFALNIGRDDWQPARVSDAYSAAIGTDFKMFFSFDMASFPCGGEGDGNLLRQLIKGYNGHPNQLVYKDKNFVSTFGGQFCRFGAGSLDDGWYNIMKKDMPPVHFVPAFFINPSELQNMRSIDGAYSVRLSLSTCIRRSTYRMYNAVGLSVANGQIRHQLLDRRRISKIPQRTHIHGWGLTLVLHCTFQTSFLRYIIHERSSSTIPRPHTTRT